MNPVNGGRPPKDRIVKENIMDKLIEFISICGICENDNDFHVLSIINIGVIITEYIVKYVMGISAELVIVPPITHPICVIEE
jgi:hypothetical protein